MRLLVVLLGATVVVAAGAPVARAQDAVASVQLPDFDLYRTTAEPLAHRTLVDGAWQDTPAPVAPRRLVLAIARLGHGGDAALGVGLALRAGWRPARDRLVQLRSWVEPSSTGVLGDHRLRVQHGIDAGWRRVVPELDLAARHGDPARRLVGTGRAWGDAIDLRTAARVTMIDRGAWWGDAGVRVPVEASAHVRHVRDRAGGVRVATTRAARAGLGVDFGSRYQPDGWWELVGVTVARTELDATPPPLARALPAELTTLDRVDLRVASLDDVVLVDDLGEIAVHAIRLGHTWLRDPATGRSARLVTGGIGTVTRFWDRGVVGVAVGRDARLTEDARTVADEWRVEARAELRTRRRTGASLTLSSSRLSSLDVGPSLPTTWQHAAHSRVHLGLGPVELGLEHLADLRLEPDDTQRWHHYLGLFARLELSTRSARTLR